VLLHLTPAKACGHLPARRRILHEDTSGTFYATGLGACGIFNNDGQDIAAVSHLFYDTYP